MRSSSGHVSTRWSWILQICATLGETPLSVLARWRLTSDPFAYDGSHRR